jgi:hypothetical protein
MFGTGKARSICCGPDRMPLCVRLTALSPCSELSLDAHEQIDQYRCTASLVLADLHRQEQSEI